jgi:cytochrome c-type biogenesis protein CcmH
MIRRLALVGALLAALAAAPAALGAEPKTSLNDIEDEVMCVVCGVPLNIAESPQADRERVLIRELVEQGKTKDEVKQALVDQYGNSVLATPSAGGFEITNWVVPAIVVVGLLAGVAVLLPRWRRRSGEATEVGGAGGAPPSELDPDDARRLDDDLARYR